MLAAITTSALAFNAPAPAIMRTRTISMNAGLPATEPPAPPSLISKMRVGDGTLAGDIGFDVRKPASLHT